MRTYFRIEPDWKYNLLQSIIWLLLLLLAASIGGNLYLFDQRRLNIKNTHLLDVCVNKSGFTVQPPVFTRTEENRFR